MFNDEEDRSNSLLLKQSSLRLNTKLSNNCMRFVN